LAERLSLRYRPGLVIPAGLFLIGLGFFAMKLGSGVENASWLTMLPGCVLAGIGLGFTNTPVTNTTTAAVSAARAGMASGIDMSARMISLAINIALMGFLLVEGVRSSLQAALPADVEPAALRQLAQRVASGAGVSAGIPEAVVHQALVDGFGWILLYGGVGVWLLAMFSYLAFGRGRAKPAACAAQPVAR